MNQDQQRRYSRNIILSQIGEAGQQKLFAAKVLVIGAGGLGSAVLSYLAAAGVGHIGIIDGDRVELSNLQRQIIHENSDIGRLKVESARDRVDELNPDVKVTIYPFYLSSSSGLTGGSSQPASQDPRFRGDDIIKEYDIVADGCDNFATRFVVADICEQLKKPLVSAAVSGFSGQLSTFKPYLGVPHPRYRDFVPDVPPEADTCTETGVVSAICGILGSMQALEVIKEILGVGESLSGTLIRYDGLTQKFTRTELLR